MPRLVAVANGGNVVVTRLPPAGSPRRCSSQTALHLPINLFCTSETLARVIGVSPSGKAVLVAQ